jgi:hypothetical protein
VYAKVNSGLDAGETTSTAAVPTLGGMTKTLLTRGLSLAAALVLVAGCTDAVPDAAPPAPSDAGPASASASASAAPAGPAGAWREFVSCARDAGHADWPDAQVAADGTATFPQTDGFNLKEAYQQVRDRCGPLLADLPPQANPYNEQLTPAQIETVRRYVECLHQNGMPDVPAPDANGRFREPEKYFQPEFNDVRVGARQACDHILLEATE